MGKTLNSEWGLPSLWKFYETKVETECPFPLNDQIGPRCYRWVKVLFRDIFCIPLKITFFEKLFYGTYWNVSASSQTNFWVVSLKLEYSFFHGKVFSEIFRRYFQAYIIVWKCLILQHQSQSFTYYNSLCSELVKILIIKLFFVKLLTKSPDFII